MYIRKVLRLTGIVIASLALVTMIVSVNGNLLSSSFAQGEQNINLIVVVGIPAFHRWRLSR